MNKVHSPVISIITPCLNRASFIEEAINSVLDQDYPNFEHLIIDGGSTDGTLDILKKYPQLHVISESDHGLYDALNKGIQIAKGEIIGHLNTDDCYEPNIFKTIAQSFIENENIDAVVGQATLFTMDHDGKYITLEQHSSINPNEYLHRITLGAILFNSWFLRKSIIQKIGLYNTKYKLAADREFHIRAAIHGLQYKNLEKPVYHYRQHPGSLTFTGSNQPEKALQEEYFQIASQFIHNPNTPEAIRQACKKWYTTDSIETTIRSFRNMQPLTTLTHFINGWKMNWKFPAILLNRILPGISRRLHINKQ